MSYENWKKRLAGEKVTTYLQPTELDAGYYRKPITKKLPNGRTEVTGWIPVALWVEGRPKQGDVLCGLIGAGKSIRELKPDELTGEEFWSWIVPHPISYATYKLVAEDGGEWPDMGDPARNGRVLSENVAPAEPAKKPEDMTVEDHRKGIETLIAAAKEAKVTTEAEAAIVLGTRNRLAELRLGADKAGRAIYEPLYRQYQAIQKAWAPMVATAAAEEKRLDTLLLTFRESERQRIASEAAAAAAKAAAAAAAEAERLAIEEERNQRAADRAIARGEPEEFPLVEETVVAPVAAVATAAPTPAPAPLMPTYGSKKLKEVEKTFVTITEPLTVATHFIAAPELLAVLQLLAETAVKAGHTVPGITTRKGLI